MSTLTMTRSEREAFLADVHVGVFSAVDAGGATITVPIWYSYEPGAAVTLIMARSSLKAKAVAASGRLSLCAQQEAIPYKYVSVEGPATTSAAGATEDERRAMAERYLGKELTELYMQSTEGADDVIVRMTPDSWRTTDYAKQFGDVTA